MITMLRRISDNEGAEITNDALALITRAAEGSARDAQSLLDQAISHGAGETSADQVRAMLGLADRGRVLDLFDMVIKGDASAALNELSSQYADGADPLAVLRDLAEVTHWISVVKITPEAAEDPTVNPDERARGQAMADTLPMRSLTRMWQMLLKALDEVSSSPNAMMAAEMAVIRLTHVADLPSPDELIRKLQAQPTPPGPPPSGGGRSAPAPQGGGATAMGSTMAPSGPTHGAPTAALAQETVAVLSQYPTFEHVVELIRHHRDAKLLIDVEGGVKLANYQPGRIEFVPSHNAPQDLAHRLGTKLQAWTGARWAVTLVNDGGADTIAEKRDAADLAIAAEAQKHPLVQAVMTAFPKAKITKIKSTKEIEAEAQTEALQEVEDEWDPFEEE